MRIPVNLASEPFQQVRPVLAATAALGLVLSASLASLLYLTVQERGRAAETRREIAALQQQVASLSREQAQLQELLRRPENAAVLDQAAFLNSLLYRKAISWTRIFGDLEGVMPHNVRLISIRPQVDSQSEIFLDMVVASQAQPPVIEMLQRMENSPLFGSVEVHSWTPPSQEQPLYRYRVSVNYNRRL
jgi:type IV pilus assembly protein PilN